MKGDVRLRNSYDGISNLIIAKTEEEAEYIKIIKELYRGGNVTVGKIYRVERMHYNDNPADFLNGEAYIVNDVGKDFFGVFNMCVTEMYKRDNSFRTVDIAEKKGGKMFNKSLTEINDRLDKLRKERVRINELIDKFEAEKNIILAEEYRGR
jgi:hypothetical protein